MARKKKQITLNPDTRKALQKYVSTGKKSAQSVRKARIILELDKKTKTDAEIAEIFGVSRQTIQAIKSKYLSSTNLDAFLERKKRETPPVPSKITGDVEAHIIALACSEPPKGYARWSLRLLADKSVELGYCDQLSHMTVSKHLKKTSLNLT